MPQELVRVGSSHALGWLGRSHHQNLGAKFRREQVLEVFLLLLSTHCRDVPQLRQSMDALHEQNVPENDRTPLQPNFDAARQVGRHRSKMLRKVHDMERDLECVFARGVFADASTVEVMRADAAKLLQQCRDGSMVGAESELKHLERVLRRIDMNFDGEMSRSMSIFNGGTWASSPSFQQESDTSSWLASVFRAPWLRRLLPSSAGSSSGVATSRPPPGGDESPRQRSTLPGEPDGRGMPEDVARCGLLQQQRSSASFVRCTGAGMMPEHWGIEHAPGQARRQVRFRPPTSSDLTSGAGSSSLLDHPCIRRCGDGHGRRAEARG